MSAHSPAAVAGDPDPPRRTDRAPDPQGTAGPERDPRSDDALMTATASGDREAFAELVDRHKDGLVGYLARLSGDPERARDLAQESFLRLYQSAEGYEERGQLKAYLYRIATNLVRSQARKARRFRLLRPFLDRPESEPARAPGRVLRDEARRQLARAVAELPLRYRVPLVLHEIEGWTFRDVARHLGCKEGTAKSRVHRARRKLKERLAPYWHGESDWEPAARLEGETP